MKPFKEVEETRKKYHSIPFQDTVHRSSLLVPHIKNTKCIITFLNHFLLKRGNLDVVIKISAIDIYGKKLKSISYEINQKKVYSFNLSNIFENLEYHNFIVEFFSSKNLFIPFPAVLINHLGKNFCNIVHSYNRILNDIFEEDAVNKVNVSEASFDVLVNDEFDTFINFSSGMNKLNDKILFQYNSNDVSLEKKLNIEMPRLTHKSIFLSDIFNMHLKNGTIKVLQPKQNLFFGRVLAGIQNKKDGSFSANHSYYDSSLTEEYFEIDNSYRTYPFFQNLVNKISMYPIMSPSNLKIAITIFYDNNKKFTKNFALESPSNDSLHININEIAKNNKINLEKISTFAIFAKNTQGMAPTRINHQLIYGSTNSINPINTSINVSLMNDKIFKSKNKESFVWGQIINSSDYKSLLGINFISSEGKEENVELEFYNSKGMIKKFTQKLYPKKSLILSSEDIISNQEDIDFIWYVAKSKRSDLSAFFTHINNQSGHSSGDHTF